MPTNQALIGVSKVREITKLQQKYLDWLLRMTLKNHNFPTRQETANHFGVNLNAAQFQIVELERKGYIKQLPYSPKYKFTNIKLVEG